MHVGSPNIRPARPPARRRKRRASSRSCASTTTRRTGLVRALPGLRGCDRGGFQDLHARRRAGSDWRAVEGERVPAQSPGHPGRARAGDRCPPRRRSRPCSRWASPARCGSRPSISPMTSRRQSRSGTIKFAIDQQPYLQGYIPVRGAGYREEGSHHRPRQDPRHPASQSEVQERLATYGLAPAYGPRNIGSGPGFITKENVDKVIKYAGQFR